MQPGIAVVIFTLGIAGLFWLDRDAENRASKALWIPVIWVLINGSRPISEWMSDFGWRTADLPVSSAERYLDGTPVDRNIYLCLIIIALIILIVRGKSVSTILLRNAPILLFFIYCAISIAWSDYSFVSFKRWVKATGDVLMVLIVLTDPAPKEALKRLFSRTAFLLIPISVLFIKYYPELGREYNLWSWRPAYSGVTSQKNLLGMLCLVLGLGILWQFIDALKHMKGSIRARKLFAHFVIVAMAIWLFWVANSMTSLVCFVLAASVLTIFSFGWLGKQPGIVHIVVIAAIAVPAIVLFSGFGTAVLGSLGRDPTLTGRTGIWDAVLSVGGNPFFGTGYESFWLGDRLQAVWNLTVQGLQEAHNGYLELYLNLGWVGICLLAGIIVAGYRNVIVALRADQTAANLRLGLLVAAIIYNFTEAGFRETSLTWICFLLAVTFVPITAPSESLAFSKADLPAPLADLPEFPVRTQPIGNFAQSSNTASRQLWLAQHFKPLRKP